MGLYNKVTKRDNFTVLYRREAKFLQKSHEFDAVIAFQEGTTTEFVSYFLNVKKIAWIHCTYGAWAGGIRRRQDECYFSFDGVACVSESAKHSFVNLFPELKERVHSIYNLLNVSDITNKTKEPIPEGRGNQSDIFRILSVGRLSAVKQFELIPSLAHEVRDRVRRPFQWYIIGSGDCETTIREEIFKYHVEDIVILLGAKDNPYPYMKVADLVVCTSLSESFSYVIAEAKVLHTPVLSNDFPVAYEVVDESCGWIANIKDMPQLLTNIINDKEKNGEYSKKRDSIQNYEYSNAETLKKIEMLFQ